jgi:hypothetical protein
MEDFSTRKCEPWLSHFFRYGQSVSICPATVRTRNKFQSQRMWDTIGKGEKFRIQSQERQELSATPGPSQLILKMTSDHQTVDHTNKIDHDVIFGWFRTTFSNGTTICDTSRVHDMWTMLMYISLYWSYSRLARKTILEFPVPIPGNFYSKVYLPVMGGSRPLASNGETQTLRTVFKRTLVVHRPPTRHVDLCSHKFGQKNHTTTSLVRSCNNIPVITSKALKWN